MTLIRNRLGLLVLGVLVTFVLYLLLPAIQHERFTAHLDDSKPLAMEERSQQDANTTVLTGTIEGDPPILYREAFLLQKAGTPSPKRWVSVLTTTAMLGALVGVSLHALQVCVWPCHRRQIRCFSWGALGSALDLGKQA